LTKRRLILAKSAVWLASQLPLARLLGRGWNTVRGAEPDLGANPLEFVTLSTGTWALVFLLATLGVTPLRRLTGWNPLIRFRRLLGLFAFFYACLHLLTYLWFDKFFAWGEILRDIPKRPFITVGFLAWSLLLLLAATSTSWAIRTMGGRRWNLLHKLIYVAAIAAIVHFTWKVKSDLTVPLRYAAVLALLLGFRVVMWLRVRRARGPGADA
jgi:sulfoxide reductase heme-binding subunit YedZ